jgi:hypothetical protein
MCSPVPLAVGAALCLATLLPAARAAEEAVLPDGRHRPGVLRFAGGRLHFQPDASTAALALADIHDVRFAAAPALPLFAGRVHRVLLTQQQSLTGQLLDLEEQRLRLRTAWADRLIIPRPALSAVVQLPGWDTFFAPEFAPDFNGWSVLGGPTLGEERSPAGQRCVVLSRPGQALVHDLAQPLAAGWLAVDFRAAEPGGGRWLAEADFRARTVGVTVAGDGDSYRVDVAALQGTSHRLARTPGWHRLRLDFAPDRLAVTIDDTAVWSAEGRGPGGALRQVRLACTEGTGAGDCRGMVSFADVSLARPLPEGRHPPGDPRQDEVWLASGDQVFGQVPQADSQGLELAGRFGKRTLSWGEVRGVFLRDRDRAPAAPTTDGEQVRVWLWPGAGEQHDELVGAVRGLDERWLTLEHPLLGECKIERGRLRQLRGSH